MKTVFRLAILLLATLLAQAALAESALIGEKSAIRFISVKNAAVAEVHYFGNLSGSISDSGEVSVTVPLVDVETLIPIRNERMQKLFFETAQFPTAQLSASVDMQRVKALANGEYMGLDLRFALDLHGISRDLSAPVTVTRLGDEIHVATLQPLVLNVADFKLGEGVERLREIAGLKNISTAVPVTANLVFTR